MYTDLSDVINLEGLIKLDSDTEAFNIPYAEQTNGSYFGDSDSLIRGQDKNERDSCAQANDGAIGEVMLIKKNQLL